MTEHPIQGLMKTALDSIKQMVDVNTVVGTPVETQDGSVIMPVSRVTFGFAAGGGDFEEKGSRRRAGGPARRRGDPPGQESGESRALPFAGGSGAGVSVQPVGFLVVAGGDVRLITVEGMPVLERLVDLAPALLDQVTALVQPDGDDKQGGKRGQGQQQAGRQGRGGDKPGGHARRFRFTGGRSAGQE